MTNGNGSKIAIPIKIVAVLLAAALAAGGWALVGSIANSKELAVQKEHDDQQDEDIKEIKESLEKIREEGHSTNLAVQKVLTILEERERRGR